MTKKRLLQGATWSSGALALLLLAACGELPWAGHGGGSGGSGGGVKVFNKPTGPAANGHYQCQAGASCDLTIDVDNCKVVEDMTEVQKGQNIFWNVPQGWTFAANGIAFKPGPPDPTLAFDKGHPVGQTQFKWHVKPDAPSGTGPYKYGVHLTGPGGKTCDFDPSLWV